MTLKSPPKLLLATAVCLVLSALAGAAALAAQGGGKPAATTVTIESAPVGVTGKVSSASVARCAEGRRVVVYRARGSKPDPQTDQRIGATRVVGVGGQFGWTVETEGGGRLYAQAAAKHGCAVGLSRVLGTGVGAGTDSASYPICGTYASETSSRICRIENLTLRTFAYPGEQVCRLETEKTRDRCTTFAVSGPYPWSGEGQGGSTSWKPDASGQGRIMTFERAQNDRPGVTATLIGTIPSPTSQRFSVTDAYAPDEGTVAPGGAPAGGDHFYTPELPGALVGEVGGPLKMEIGQAPSGYSYTFNGYLYLKR